MTAGMKSTHKGYYEGSKFSSLLYDTRMGLSSLVGSSRLVLVALCICRHEMEMAFSALLEAYSMRDLSPRPSDSVRFLSIYKSLSTSVDTLGLIPN